jgi:hypothetical protein
MSADDVVEESRSRIRTMLSSWTKIPAFLCDRHLTVVASNNAARALSPAFAEGMNLARFTFLEPDLDRDHDMYDSSANQVVALLRESLDQHRGDDLSFRAIVGDLSVMSVDFAAAWADDSLSAKAHGVADFADTPVGVVRMGYQVLRVPDNEEDSLLVWGAADEESSRALGSLLASAAEDDSAR